jgi:uncharacterized protein DUF3558
MRERLHASVLLCIGLAAAAVLNGCGPAQQPSGNASPTPPASSPAIQASPSPAAVPDPCVLVNQADGATLTGTSMTAGQEGNPDNPSCTYGSATSKTAQVQVFVGDGAKKTLDIDRQLGHAFTAVPNVGDEAFEEHDAIFFRKGTVWVAIELVLLNDPEQNRVPLEQLAAKAAGRM